MGGATTGSSPRRDVDDTDARGGARPALYLDLFLEHVAEGYRDMDAPRTIKTLLRLQSDALASAAADADDGIGDLLKLRHREKEVVRAGVDRFSDLMTPERLEDFEHAPVPGQGLVVRVSAIVLVVGEVGGEAVPLAVVDEVAGEFEQATLEPVVAVKAAEVDPVTEVRVERGLRRVRKLGEGPLEVEEHLENVVDQVALTPGEFWFDGGEHSAVLRDVAVLEGLCQSNLGVEVAVLAVAVDESGEDAMQQRELVTLEGRETVRHLRKSCAVGLVARMRREAAKRASRKFAHRCVLRSSNGGELGV